MGALGAVQIRIIVDLAISAVVAGETFAWARFRTRDTGDFNVGFDYLALIMFLGAFLSRPFLQIDLACLATAHRQSEPRKQPGKAADLNRDD